MNNAKLTLLLSLFLFTPSLVMASDATTLAVKSVASAVEFTADVARKVDIITVSSQAVKSVSGLVEEIGSYAYISSNHKLFGLFRNIFDTLSSNVGWVGVTLIGVMAYGAYYYFYVAESSEGKVEEDGKIDSNAEWLERVQNGGYTRKEIMDYDLWTIRMSEVREKSEHAEEANEALKKAIDAGSEDEEISSNYFADERVDNPLGIDSYIGYQDSDSDQDSFLVDSMLSRPESIFILDGMINKATKGGEENSNDNESSSSKGEEEQESEGEGSSSDKGSGSGEENDEGQEEKIAKIKNQLNNMMDKLKTYDAKALIENIESIYLLSRLSLEYKELEKGYSSDELDQEIRVFILKWVTAAVEQLDNFSADELLDSISYFVRLGMNCSFGDDNQNVRDFVQKWIVAISQKLNNFNASQLDESIYFLAYLKKMGLFNSNNKSVLNFIGGWFIAARNKIRNFSHDEIRDINWSLSCLDINMFAYSKDIKIFIEKWLNHIGPGLITLDSERLLSIISILSDLRVYLAQIDEDCLQSFMFKWFVSAENKFGCYHCPVSDDARYVVDSLWFLKKLRNCFGMIVRNSGFRLFVKAWIDHVTQSKLSNFGANELANNLHALAVFYEDMLDKKKVRSFVSTIWFELIQRCNDFSRDHLSDISLSLGILRLNEQKRFIEERLRRHD